MDLLLRQVSGAGGAKVIGVRRDPGDAEVLLVDLAEGPAGVGEGRKGKRGGGRGGAEGALRVLCVHGVGHQEGDPANERTWRKAIEAAWQGVGAGRGLEVEFVAYDGLFGETSLGAEELWGALWKLGRSGVVHGLGDLFGRRARGDFSAALRWTAGMVVQWVENEGLRRRCREALRDHVERFRPDVILAHSLGSLIAYDTFSRPETAMGLKGRVLVTFGSQIGNAFVRSSVAFSGRIEPLPSARHWFHLYNSHDDAFTAPLRLWADNFTQVATTFDRPGMLDHDAAAYLAHRETTDRVWRTLGVELVGRGGRGGVRAVGRGRGAGVASMNLRPPKPEKRALLVGINDYSQPGMRLEGCVNDVFLVSGMLQEFGFASENVRVLLNERATASGILERLEWLLDGAETGQERVFYFSGHGAQLPGYGERETVDECDECLVPVDFDWSLEHAVTDNQFHDWYSQLPYGTRFLTVFDCCHSGGLSRDGGMRVRGVNPPDDIRHRLLKWENGGWRPRREEVETGRAALVRSAFVKRLGRAAELRRRAGAKFKEECRTLGHKGPYMPVILEACRENQYAYEYRHGATAYGAFTWLLVETMRRRLRRGITWEGLVEQVNVGLGALGYPQSAVVEGPSQVIAGRVGWRGR